MLHATDLSQKLQFDAATSNLSGLNPSGLSSSTSLPGLEDSQQRSFSSRAGSDLSFQHTFQHMPRLEKSTLTSSGILAQDDADLPSARLDGQSAARKGSSGGRQSKLMSGGSGSQDAISSFGVGVSTTGSKALRTDSLLSGGTTSGAAPGTTGSLSAEAGNTLGTARNLGTLGTLSTQQQRVDNADPNDMYRVNVTNGVLNLALTGMTADADVRVIRDANNNGIVDSGEVIRSSTFGGTTDETINLAGLTSGNYFVDVYRYSTNATNYTLRLSNTNPNSLLAKETDIGALTGVRTFGGTMNNSNTSDVYAFSLGSTNNVNIALTGMTNDADVRLIRDANNNGVIDSTDVTALSSRSGSADDAINLSGVAAGNYFMQVYRYSGDTNYSVNLSTGRPSDLLPKENNVGALSGTRVFSGNVGNTNTADIYAFSLGSAASAFNLTLSGMSSDADVRLVRDANNNGIVDAGEVLNSSSAGGTGGEIIRQSLGAGNYWVEVYQFSGNTNYNLSLSTGDWYNQNLSDAGLIGQTRALYFTDGSLSRNDMMAVLRETKDHGSIDATELTDLRKIVNPTTGFTMPEYVRNLSNKVVNSDAANPRSGIGNLFAGSTDAQMENLVGKWFLGSDRPDAGWSYSNVSGSLFRNGINFTDIVQGAASNCYFVASLAAAAFRSSSHISNMFTDNGDNTFSIRFFNGSKAEYVTVDRFLPTSGGGAAYAGWGGGSNTSTTNELWVALAEKAYAQVNESGWIAQDNTNSYAGIDFGWPFDALRHITGRATTQQSINATNIVNAFNAGRMIVLNTNATGTEAGIVDNHSYAMVGYTAATDTFTLYNPWGNTVNLTRAQINRNFRNWDSTTT